jgi:Carboxypeptidase regulatory-like domain
MRPRDAQLIILIVAIPLAAILFGLRWFLTPESELRPSNAVPETSPVRLAFGAVQGRVTNSVDGKPVAGVHAWADIPGQGRGLGIGEAVTDAKGNYQIAHLKPGVYVITLTLSAEQQKYATARALQHRDLKPGTTLTGQDFTLIPGSWITGKVTDKITGQPLAGVDIGIYGPAHPRSRPEVQDTTTGLNGVYRARVPAGKQYVYVTRLPDVEDQPNSLYRLPTQGVHLTVAEHATRVQDFKLIHPWDAN